MEKLPDVVAEPERFVDDSRKNREVRRRQMMNEQLNEASLGIDPNGSIQHKCKSRKDGDDHDHPLGA